MKELDYKVIGERLKKLRKYLNLTQEQVASILKLGRDAIIRIEKGERKIDINELKNFSKLYCVTIDELVSEKKSIDENTVAFARAFDALTDKDKKEIISLIELKNKIKN